MESFGEHNELVFPLFPVKLIEIYAGRSLYCFESNILLSVICFSGLYPVNYLSRTEQAVECYLSILQ